MHDLQRKSILADLTCTYMGLELNSPLVVSASPLSDTVSHVRQMEDAGAGAVVLRSLFEEIRGMMSQATIANFTSSIQKS